MLGTALGVVDLDKSAYSVVRNSELVQLLQRICADSRARSEHWDKSEMRSWKLSYPLSANMWVDRATAETGIRLTAPERRRLIAALLSRRHLILSGLSDIGKRKFAHELALSITNGQKDRVCLLQGHPWWATGTDNVGYFVDLQTRFSTWQLAYFADFLLTKRAPTTQQVSGSDQGSQTHDNTDGYVVCVERLSRLEIEFYYGAFAAWLLKSAPVKTRPAPIRLIGTYDSDMPPDQDDFTLGLTAVIHLSGVQRRGVTSLIAPIRKGNTA